MGVGDTYRITQNVILIDNVNAQNVFYVRQDTSGSGQISDIKDDISDWMNQIYAPLVDIMMNTATATDWKMEVKQPGNCKFNLFTDGDTNAGGQVGMPNEQTAHGVALQINARLVGYGRVGIKYWGGISNSFMDNGTWGTTALAAALSAGVGWTTPFIGVGSNASWIPSVWSCVRLLTFPFSGTLITRPVSSYQRRRKPGVGI